MVYLLRAKKSSAACTHSRAHVAVYKGLLVDLFGNRLYQYVVSFLRENNWALRDRETQKVEAVSSRGIE